jgi:hypothetical protein
MKRCFMGVEMLFERIFYILRLQKSELDYVAEAMF